MAVLDELFLGHADAVDEQSQGKNLNELAAKGCRGDQREATAKNYRTKLEASPAVLMFPGEVRTRCIVARPGSALVLVELVNPRWQGAHTSARCCQADAALFG
jgi:hypothetical protein